MVRACGLGLTIVVTYAVITLADLGLYWVEFGLMLAAVVGIGVVVARAGVDRPFLKAAVVSFVTVLCIELFVYLELTLPRIGAAAGRTSHRNSCPTDDPVVDDGRRHGRSRRSWHSQPSGPPQVAGWSQLRSAWVCEPDAIGTWCPQECI